MRSATAALRSATITGSAGETPVEDGLSTRDRVAIHTLGFYFIAKMFYAFGGGSVQPADLILALVAVFLVRPATLRQLWSEQRIFLLFMAWAVIVNVGWSIYAQRLDFILSGFYYIFNTLVVVCAYATRQRAPKAFDRIIIAWILASITLQFIILIAGRGYGRAVGTFRNPNQLSYWAVCAMSVLLILRGSTAKMVDLPFQLMALWCQLVSASRAGLGASALLFLVWAFFALETPTKKMVGALTMGLIAVLALAAPFAQDYLANSKRFSVAEARINRESDVSELEVRNYNRILEYYEYTVIGAGEGNLSRFRQTLGADLEIHSTFGTVYFSYGIIGFTLFMLFLGNLARKAGIGLIIYLVPALVYGLTHQGMRFSFFWLLIGLLMSFARGRASAGRPEESVGASQPPAVRTYQQRGPEFLRSLIDTAPSRPSRLSVKGAGEQA